MTEVLHIDARWIVQLTLCSALLTCIGFVLFRRNAVTRRAYALTAGLVLVALPFALALSSTWHWTAPFEVVAHLSLAGSVAVPVWLLWTWAGVAACLNASALVGIARARQRLAALPPVADSRIAAEAAFVARQLSFARPYSLHVGAAAYSASLAGNRLVLPAEAEGWTRDALRAVLAHEFVHLARRDDLGLLVLRLVLHWYWFAPWVGLLRGVYATAMEQSCDDRAAECLPTSAEYLHGVLCAVRAKPAAPPIAAALGGSEVVARFRRFLGIRERQLDAAGMYWGLTTVLGTALLLTSVEFEASEPAPSPWPAAAGPRPHAVAIQTAVSTLPQIHERAVTGGERAARRPAMPIYPGEALRKGIEGHVVVAFRISGDGRVVRPAVVASEPPGVFDAVALRAVAMREYEPDRAPALSTAGRGPPDHLVRRFEFRLPDPD